MIGRLIAQARALANSPARPWLVLAGSGLLGLGVAMIQRYAGELGEHLTQAEQRYAELVERHDDLAAEYRNGTRQLEKLGEAISQHQGEIIRLQGVRDALKYEAGAGAPDDGLSADSAEAAG